MEDVLLMMQHFMERGVKLNKHSLCHGSQVLKGQNH